MAPRCVICWGGPDEGGDSNTLNHFGMSLNMCDPCWYKCAGNKYEDNMYLYLYLKSNYVDSMSYKEFREKIGG